MGNYKGNIRRNIKLKHLDKLKFKFIFQLIDKDKIKTNSYPRAWTLNLSIGWKIMFPERNSPVSFEIKTNKNVFLNLLFTINYNAHSDDDRMMMNHYENPRTINIIVRR